MGLERFRVVGAGLGSRLGSCNFRVTGFGFWVLGLGLGLRVAGLGLWVEGFRDMGLGFGVEASGFRNIMLLWVQALGLGLWV